MAKKVQLKTSKNEKDPAEFIQRIDNQELKEECEILLKIFAETTGLEAKMWGDSIIGFGEYTYHRANGDEGVFMACGFSPRKSGPTIYILPGYQDFSHILENLGPHKLGKSCLYLKNLKNIRLDVLQELILAGLAILKSKYKTSF